MEFDNLNPRPGNSWKLISGIMYTPDLPTIRGCPEFIIYTSSHLKKITIRYKMIKKF